MTLVKDGQTKALSKVLMLSLQNTSVPSINSLYNLSLNLIAKNAISLDYKAKHEFLSSILYPDIQREIMIEMLKVNCNEPCECLASVLTKRRDFEGAYKICPDSAYPQKHVLAIFSGNFTGKSLRSTLSATVNDAKCNPRLSSLSNIIKGYVPMDLKSKVPFWQQML